MKLMGIKDSLGLRTFRRAANASTWFAACRGRIGSGQKVPTLDATNKLAEAVQVSAHECM